MRIKMVEAKRLAMMMMMMMMATANNQMILCRVLHTQAIWFQSLGS